MNVTQLLPRSIFVILCLALLAACRPTLPTPVTKENVQVVKITHNETVDGQIIQTKTFDRCNAAGAFSAEVKFGESTSETAHKELALTVGAGAEAQIPAVAKATIEAAVEERFSYAKQIIESHEEGVKIEVPAHTRQEYTIIWKETRDEGTIEYIVNGEQKVANYSYRVGLDFDSAIGRDIDCGLPTATLSPTETPVPSNILVTATPVPLTLREGCISSKRWKPDSLDSNLVNTIPINPDGCYVMEEPGIFANLGTIHLIKETKNNTTAAGIYMPINSNAVIEFKIYINSMSMRFDDIAEVIFAVTPANDRLTAKPTTRFKLHLEDSGYKRLIHFMMADAGENTGVKLGTRHYEYGQTYSIHLLLINNQMDVFIDNHRINESLELPLGSKVFYIGYTWPVFAELDINISELTVDGLVP